MILLCIHEREADTQTLQHIVDFPVSNQGTIYNNILQEIVLYILSYYWLREIFTIIRNFYTPMLISCYFHNYFWCLSLMHCMILKYFSVEMIGQCHAIFSVFQPCRSIKIRKSASCLFCIFEFRVYTSLQECHCYSNVKYLTAPFIGTSASDKWNDQK